ncbi:MAG: response regulator transcription factor, partial [Gammaproteobacteria bacterium]
MRILVVEDSEEIGATVEDYLSGRGHVTSRTRDGRSALKLALAEDFDVLVVDIMLPGMDGLQLISRLRNAAGVDIPILILSGCGTLPDKLNGFQCGADDYLVKPFDLPELEARLLALHRRQVGNSANTLRVADLEFDVATLTVKRAGMPLKLKPTALKLLKILMRETGRVVSRQELERTLWGSELPDSDSLRT